jgi:Na+/H+ antiporter NhaC
MIIPARLLLAALTVFAMSAVAAQAVELEAPKVLLDGLAADVGVRGLPPGPAELVLNGEVIGSGDEGQISVEAVIQNTGSAVFEVFHNGESILQQDIPVIPGWVSLLPPLIAIALSFLLRSVIPSLFAGLLMGAWAANGLSFTGALVAVFDTMSIYILNAMVDPDHGAIILFSLMIGGMVGIISRNGGMVGIVNRVIPIAKTPRRGQIVIATLGLGIFFDDYANTMIVGNAARPISDHLKISREKLAYLVDSTAAPISTIAVITTWIGFQVGLIDDAIRMLPEIQQSAYSLFLQSIPYSFYPFLAVFFVFLVVFSGKDFGPMYKAEIRARTTGQVTRDRGDLLSASGIEDLHQKPHISCRAVNGVVPILFLVGGVIGGMAVSGEGDTVKQIVGSANAYMVLIWASLLGCLSAIVLSLSQRLLSLEEVVEAWTAGAKFMITGLILLVMAWAIADVTAVLQTAPYLISILGDTLSPYSLPAIVFLLAALAAFGSGSSWGVMAILMPLVIPLCWAVMHSNGIADAAHMHILYSCIACVLTGAVWADHCSPISDTTVLSSLATGCDHMDHVTTQLPYALLGGLVALSVCVLPVGYGLPWWLMLPLGAVVLVSVHRFLSKPTDP